MFEEIASNKKRTILLIGVFAILTSLVMSTITLFFFEPVTALIVSAVLVVLLTAVGYWRSAKVALSITKARVADKETYKNYHETIESLAIASGLPKPDLYVIDDPSPNAFATGHKPEKSAIAVTTGLLAIMNRVELEGVLAHEMAHIRNRDILVASVAITMLGIIIVVGNVMGRVLIFGGGGRGRSRNSNSGGGLIFLAVGLILIIIAPFAGKLLQLAVSRNRETLADVSGVEMVRYPYGLMSALKKIEAASLPTWQRHDSVAHIWLNDPNIEPEDKEAGKFKKWWSNLMKTHPPIDGRIHQLAEISGSSMDTSSVVGQTGWALPKQDVALYQQQFKMAKGFQIEAQNIESGVEDTKNWVGNGFYPPPPKGAPTPPNASSLPPPASAQMRPSGSVPPPPPPPGHMPIRPN